MQRLPLKGVPRKSLLTRSLINYKLPHCVNFCLAYMDVGNERELGAEALPESKIFIHRKIFTLFKSWN